jgi:hypothetical protein
MRVAPLGAYFADDLDKVVDQDDPLSPGGCRWSDCRGGGRGASVAAGKLLAIVHQWGISAASPSKNSAK